MGDSVGRTSHEGLCFSAINGSAPACLSDLLHVHTLSRTLRSSSDTRIQEFMALAPFLASDPTFGSLSHKNLGTGQPQHRSKTQ